MVISVLWAKLLPFTAVMLHIKKNSLVSLSALCKAAKDIWYITHTSSLEKTAIFYRTGTKTNLINLRRRISKQIKGVKNIPATQTFIKGLLFRQINGWQCSLLTLCSVSVNMTEHMQC